MTDKCQSSFFYFGNRGYTKLICADCLRHSVSPPEEVAAWPGVQISDGK